MSRFLFVPACLLIVLAACKPAAESDVKAVIGAVLIDGSGGPPVSDSVVIVAGSRIRAAGRRSDVPIPAGSEKVDGSGKFLVPGLIDLHVHLGATGGPGFRPADYTRERVEKNLAAYLYFGVTTVRSVGTEREAGFEVRKAQRSGSGPLQTARLFTVGRGFTARGGHPSQEIGEIARQTEDPGDARKQVSELAAQQVDGIKIWIDDLHGRQPKIKPAVVEAILDEARKHDIPVTAHIFTLADARHFVDNGGAGFLHMIRDTDDIPQEFIQKLRNLRLVFTPTLVRQELAWLYTEHPELLDDPDVARTVEPAAIAYIRDAARGVKVPELSREEFYRAKRNTKKLADAGVPIGVGSDGGSSADLPGLMTHREMELLASAGLAPMDILVAATRHGALALRKSEEMGTVEPGKLADLVLVDANPLEDIRSLRKIHRVMLNGQWVDRAALSPK